MSLTFARDKRLPDILDRLSRAWPSPARPNAEPLSQLVFMVLVGGTPTAVALAVFQRLRQRFRNWGDLRDADPDVLLPVLRGVERVTDKATTLPRLLQAIETKRGELDLGFLEQWNSDEAMTWLCALPGVDATIAAATLSFSTLRKTVATVDQDSARPVRRLRLAPEGTPISALDRHIMERMPADWKAAELNRLYQGLTRLADKVCHRGKPDCKHCPLSDLCPTAANSTATILTFPGAAQS
ncbi:endonuclease III domain-containing protein [Aquisalinus flavus]|nr:hypothetical protein [Aquisalinus flavus]MBD0427573.1 hypothetical protein [Aquisalinus flavus]UNE47365.1 hypothetical protein FF099_04455 [Aquisalinus flavus]